MDEKTGVGRLMKDSTLKMPLEPGWFYIHSKCHYQSPTWCRIKDDKLEILCAKCNSLILSVTVSHGLPKDRSCFLHTMLSKTSEESK